MKKKITIVIPVYNDWDCMQSLMQDISTNLSGRVDTIHLIAINDCSIESPPTILTIPENVTYSQVDLVTNVGHQRAILIGLCYCYEHSTKSDYVIIMDSDGEDNPKYIYQFLNRAEISDTEEIIFAKRSKRSEGFAFRLSYFSYKILFKVLTGSSISFGNFSCIPISMLSKVCHHPDFWNHYSASVIKSKLPHSTIPTERSKRYSGFSKMNSGSLILHGLSSLSVYIESIIIRALKLSFVIFLLLVIVGIAVVIIKYFSGYAIPGWATNVFGFILNLLFTVVLFNLIIILLHLHNRNKPISKPLDFYKSYINHHP
jgi:polyisoprenyl-phosphate glycosyltransferase